MTASSTPRIAWTPAAAALMLRERHPLRSPAVSARVRHHRVAPRPPPARMQHGARLHMDVEGPRCVVGVSYARGDGGRSQGMPFPQHQSRRSRRPCHSWCRIHRHKSVTPRRAPTRGHGLVAVNSTPRKAWTPTAAALRRREMHPLRSPAGSARVRHPHDAPRPLAPRVVTRGSPYSRRRVGTVSSLRRGVRRRHTPVGIANHANLACRRRPPLLTPPSTGGPGGLPRRSGAFEPSLPGTPRGGVVQIVCSAEYPP